MKDSIHSIGSVLLAHTTALAISITDFADWLKITSLLLAIGYTIFKWRSDLKQNKIKKKK
jgi:uncharacterized membrane protein YjfL (UPF0719 family)